jgi:RES domain-containing protein
MAEVVGWRIVKEKHASTAFSGEGARIFEGRWNWAGVRMVYCSENLALAALEILAHTRPVTMRDKFRAFRVSWDEAIMVIIDLKKLPKGWNSQPPTAASKNIGDEWIKAGRFAILALPSVLVPLEKTFLLNPKHPDFRRIKIKDAGNFVLDPRLKR